MSGYINFINSKIKETQIQLMQLESGFNDELGRINKISLMDKYEKLAEHLNELLRKRSNYDAQKFEIEMLIKEKTIDADR